MEWSFVFIQAVSSLRLMASGGPSVRFVGAALAAGSRCEEFGVGRAAAKIVAVEGSAQQTAPQLKLLLSRF